jgi:hypothetical protein
MASPHLSDTAKHIGDGISILTVAGTLMHYLPAVAAILTIIWTAIRIYETDTVQNLLKRKPKSGDQIETGK